MIDLRKKLIERRSIELDPELAKHYLTYNTFEAQRPIKFIHLKELSEKMADGRFRFGEIAFAQTEENLDILMNGQHVCSAVMASRITVPCVLEKFGPLNHMEISTLFRQFEIEARSLKDMVRVESHALDLPWEVSFSSLLVSAGELDSKGTVTQGGFLTREQKVKILSKYIREGEMISRVVSSRHAAKHLYRVPIIYSMFLTFRKSEQDSYYFWDKVKTGEILQKHMPEMRLREYLINDLNRVLYKRTSNHEIVSKCVMAWNAFRAKKPTNLQYKVDRPIAKVL